MTPPGSGVDSVVQLLNSLCGMHKSYKPPEMKDTHPDSANPWALPINSSMLTVTVGGLTIGAAEKNLNRICFNGMILAAEPFSTSVCLADVVLRKSWMIFSSLPCISTSFEAKMPSIKPDVASSVMRVGYARNRKPLCDLETPFWDRSNVPRHCKTRCRIELS